MNAERGVALADQGSVALVRIVAFMVFARVLPPDSFGAFTLALTLSYMTNQLQHHLVVLPFIITCNSPERLRDDGPTWLWLNYLIAAALAGGLLLVAQFVAAVGGPPSLATILTYTSVTLPTLSVYMFHRRWLYQIGQRRGLIVVVVAYVLAYAVAIAVTRTWYPTPWAAVLSFTAASASGLLAAVPFMRPARWTPTRNPLRCWADTRSFSSWTALSFAVGATFNHGMNLLLASIQGAAAAGVMSATRQMVVPAQTLVTSTDSFDKVRAGAHYGTDGVAGLVRSVRSTRTYMVVLAGPYLLLLFLAAPWTLGAFYGDAFTDYVLELRLWTIASFLNLLIQPKNTQLLVLRQSRAMFVARAAGAIAALGGAALFIPTYGIAGALASLATGRFVNLVTVHFLARRVTRATRRAERAARIENETESEDEAPGSLANVSTDPVE
jgi:O-antigen/teichoic acid export membrane protein